MIFSNNLTFVREPLLTFGGGNAHQDVRFGLTEFGPVDADPDQPKQIQIGIVGTAQTVDGVRQWLTKCEGGIPKKNSKQPNLFPDFPGSDPGGPFRARLTVTYTPTGGRARSLTRRST